jgi:hypothetical protein
MDPMAKTFTLSIHLINQSINLYLKTWLWFTLTGDKIKQKLRQILFFPAKTHMVITPSPLFLHIYRYTIYRIPLSRSNLSRLFRGWTSAAAADREQRSRQGSGKTYCHGNRVKMCTVYCLRDRRKHIFAVAMCDVWFYLYYEGIYVYGIQSNRFEVFGYSMSRRMSCFRFQCSDSLLVMTSALHAEGRESNPRSE